MRINKTLYYFLAVLMAVACKEQASTKTEETNYMEGTFGYDLSFLQKHDSVVVLKDGDAQVIVSPNYQGKVFTSTAAGVNGKSFGWINYKAFTAPPDPHMNAYGGENRLWLGPEGGPFSLFFPGGVEMNFSNWKTPAPIDTERWESVSKNDQAVTMKKDMELTSYAGTSFSLTVDRTVTILQRNDVMSLAGVEFDTSIKMVGYRTENRLTNKGTVAWNEKTGAPCIWMLDMFNPSAKTVIVVPYEQPGDSTAKIATTDYFGEIPGDRIKYQNGAVLFKADGKSRGKIGLGSSRAKPVAGSFDGENRVLTITFFDVDKNGKYLNQEWTTKKPPYSGDAVNAYNDGPIEGGSQMGPFYEIESVSPAAFLQPGATLSHNHTVLHFTGNKKILDDIAAKTLGISLNELENAF